jgi:hypothetical protein
VIGQEEQRKNVCGRMKKAKQKVVESAEDVSREQKKAVMWSLLDGNK